MAIAALTAAACVVHPDPRGVSVQDAERRSLGGWAVVTDVDGFETQGELIAVDPGAIRVLVWTHDAAAPDRSAIPGTLASRIVRDHPESLAAIPRDRIRALRLYRYGNDRFVLWGTLGGVSTVSHLLLAAITLPLWIGVSLSAEKSENEATILTYPGVRLEDMALWARFPQGVPPDLPERALFPSGAPGAASPPTR